MEPRRAEQQALQPSAEPKPRRFRIVKLEERIAPAQGGNGSHNCVFTAKHCWSYKQGCTAYACPW